MSVEYDRQMLERLQVDIYFALGSDVARENPVMQALLGVAYLEDCIEYLASELGRVQQELTQAYEDICWLIDKVGKEKNDG